MANVECCFAWLTGGVAELLSGSWVAFGKVLKGLGDVLGVMLAPKIKRNPNNIEQSVAPRGRRFHCGFLMMSVSKMSSWGDPAACI